MNKDDYLNNVTDLGVDDLVKGIRDGVVTYQELQRTNLFERIKQIQVKERLNNFEKEDSAFWAAKENGTIEAYTDFLNNFPNSDNSTEMQELKKQKESELQKQRDREQEERKQREQEKKQLILDNINDYTADEISDAYGEEFLKELCRNLDVDYPLVKQYNEPRLVFNDIPESQEEVPSNFTDVFFWGIPSSGKTCALAAILQTMKSQYTIADPPLEKKFGGQYRNVLQNIFQSNKIGYLPASTQKDRTQYMPFLLKKRRERKYRQLSFFELSGEVFKYLYELNYGGEVLSDIVREQVRKGFKTLEYLLNSNNQKVHFFFIDYDKESKEDKTDQNDLTQQNYLDAAANYFRDQDDLFSRRTDAVYVVVTKSDKIEGENKSEIAKRFLDENFGSFMDVLQENKRRYSFQLRVKLFSIGDVYFSRICKLNPAYAQDIIEDLLQTITPYRNNIIREFFRR